MTPRVFLDNTVLSNLAGVGRTDLVERMWGEQATTTPQALAEYEAGAGQGRRAPGAWSWIRVETLTDEDEKLVRELPGSLGLGERACIAAARRTQGMLVTDDGDARRSARRRHMIVSGTVGILRLSVENSYLREDEAIALLDEMIRAGYFSPVVRVFDQASGSGEP